MSSATTTTMKPLTAAQHGEVLGLMLASNPEKAKSDLSARLAEVEGRIATRARIYGDPRQNHPLPETLAEVRQQVSRALPLRARVAAVADGSTPPAVEVPSPVAIDAEAHAALLAGAGQAYIDDLRRRLAPAVATLEGWLAGVVADLGVSDQRHAGGNTAGSHDDVFGRYAELVMLKDDLSARLATVRAGFDAGRKAQADLVSKAIAAAGGQDPIARGVRDSRMMQSAYWETHPGHAGLKAGGEAVVKIDADLAKLGGTDAPGPVADGLRADRKSAAAGLEKARAVVDASLKADVAGLISGAMAGDEPARAAIERAARAEPRAFPAGFADALQAAQWERSPIGPTALAMLDASGRPAGISLNVA